MNGHDENDRKVMAITGMAGNYGAVFPKATLAMWIMRFKDETAADIEAAALRLMENRQFKSLPTLADMVAALDAVKGKPTPKDMSELQAEAHVELLAAISRYGIYRDPVLSPALAAAVRAVGGWDTVCGWKESELPFRFKDLDAAFATAVEHDKALLTTSAPGQRMAALRARMAGERPAIGAPDDREGRGPVQVQEGLQ